MISKGGYIKQYLYVLKIEKLLYTMCPKINAYICDCSQQMCKTNWFVNIFIVAIKRVATKS